MARIIEGTIGRLGLSGKEIRERSAGWGAEVPIALHPTPLDLDLDLHAFRSDYAPYGGRTATKFGRD
jgi:hypothetical protein